ncbi:LmbE family protein [Richelia sinica FACHB-800]|uniref:LmbE family protein n=1 Tax=Richelia sinica FACHB-800 TaxID=1357546 RepID=A0A975T7K8_9NOST|nr:PIG-L deacetylase family protein [Richelia sinica]MBD2665769.1 PIG-L family deacetylase [Richelia sinica FACHB-800]QXE23584.1 LmbE family protein [Richelia sinica FACHB-800]
MPSKAILKQIQKLIPIYLLRLLQELHANLVSRWILTWGSTPLTVSEKSVLVFSPHQDDETFGCGGMIAIKREQKIPVTVAFLTDGRGSHGLEIQTQNQIVQVRKQESLKALSILGVEASDIYFLDHPDGSLQTLDSSSRKKIITQIIALLNSCKPGEIYVPHRLDSHQDHEATYELVKEAIAQIGMKVELLEYPIWLFWRAPVFIMLKWQHLTAAYRLAIPSVQEKKQQAIAIYNSQTQVLPHGFIQQFTKPMEIFFKTEF